MALSRTLMPSIQELVAFEAAGRHGNFTKAAVELSLTQSAISKQVHQLERTLGVLLFNRINGRVVLTELGEHYIRAASRILSDYETSTHSLIASGGSQEILSIAVLPTFASRWLIPRLTSFTSTRPSLTLNIFTESQPFDFEQKPVDVAIHYGSPSWAHAEATFLCQETIVAVAQPEYLSRKKLRSAADLGRATLLQLATRASLWTHWFAMTGVEHPNPYRGPIFDQFALTSQAAIAGMGVALVPQFFVERELKSGQLMTLDEPPVPGSGAYYAVVPVKKQHDPLAVAFVSWLVDATKEPPEKAFNL